MRTLTRFCWSPELQQRSRMGSRDLNAGWAPVPRAKGGLIGFPLLLLMSLRTPAPPKTKEINISFKYVSLKISKAAVHTCRTSISSVRYTLHQVCKVKVIQAWIEQRALSYLTTVSAISVFWKVKEIHVRSRRGLNRRSGC